MPQSSRRHPGPVQLTSKIHASLAAHESRDNEQLRFIGLHERTRDSLLLAPEGLCYDINSPSSCLSQIARFQAKATPLDFLTALAQDLETVQCLLTPLFNVIPKESQASSKRARCNIDDIQSCIRFHCIVAPSTPAAPPPPLPAENTTGHTISTHSYRAATPRDTPNTDPRPSAATLPGTSDQERSRPRFDATNAASSSVQ